MESQIVTIQSTETETEMEIETTQTKCCTKCSLVKPLTDFANNKSSTATHNSLGERLRRPECKDCTKRDAKGRNDARKISAKIPTPPAGTGCDICKKPGTSRFPILRFDHDHDTLAHRGWLCDKCNISIGSLGDNVESIIKVLNYLNKSEQKKLIIDESGQVCIETKSE